MQAAYLRWMQPKSCLSHDKGCGLSRVVCDEGSNTRWQVIEYWPTDMQKIFRDAGMPRRDGPRLPNCAHTEASSVAGEPQIVSPLKAVTYTTRLSKPAPISLRAESSNSGENRGKLYWFSNDAFLGEATAGETLAWNPPRAGRYVLRVVDEAGRADSRDVAVEMVQ